ncbi:MULTISPECIES: hypothetical protein [unclassified Pseudomonas]|uniref:hypothetical protein n=1 Tax=unclassified Pseudomonas TaxID=196821 RepID=UPI0035C064E5
MGSILSDIGDSIGIGLTDAKDGVLEMAFGDRRARLVAAQRQLELMAKDLQDTQPIFNELNQAYTEVLQTLVLQAEKFKGTFEFNASGTTVDVLRVAAAIGFSITAVGSSVAAVVGVPGKILQYGARLWALFSPARSTLAATEVEMLVVNVAARGANTAAEGATTVGSVLKVGSSMARFGAQVGKISLVLGIVTTLLQVILAGIEVAHMRNAQKEIDGHLAELKKLLPELQKEFDLVVAALKETYEQLVPEVDGKHVLLVGEGSEQKRLLLEDFFADIRSVAQAIENQGHEDMTAFQNLRARLSANNALLRTTLVPKINASSVDVSTLGEKVLIAFKALASGVPITVVETFAGLDKGLLEQLDAFRVQNQGNGKLPKLQLDGKGNLSIGAAA